VIINLVVISLSRPIAPLSKELRGIKVSGPRAEYHTSLPSRFILVSLARFGQVQPPRCAENSRLASEPHQAEGRRSDPRLDQSCPIALHSSYGSKDSWSSGGIRGCLRHRSDRLRGDQSMGCYMDFATKRDCRCHIPRPNRRLVIKRVNCEK